MLEAPKTKNTISDDNVYGNNSEKVTTLSEEARKYVAYHLQHKSMFLDRILDPKDQDHKGRLDLPVIISKNNRAFVVDTTKEIGRGSFSIVYIGYDFESGEIAAVKKFINSNSEERRISFTEKNMQEKVEDLIFAIQRVNSRLDKDEPPFEVLYVVIPYAKGYDLFDYVVGNIDERPIIKSQEEQGLIYKLKIAREFMAGVRKFHEVFGMIHRDLKAENVRFDPKNPDWHKRLKILDLGLAVEMTKDGMCISNSRVGSPLFVPTEIISKKPQVIYSQESDIFGAGLVVAMIVIFQTIEQILIDGDIAWKRNKNQLTNWYKELPDNILKARDNYKNIPEWGSYKRILDLLANMVDIAPNKRPKAKLVYIKLDQIIDFNEAKKKHGPLIPQFERLKMTNKVCIRENGDPIGEIVARINALKV